MKRFKYLVVAFTLAIATTNIPVNVENFREHIVVQAEEVNTEDTGNLSLSLRLTSGMTTVQKGNIYNIEYEVNNGKFSSNVEWWLWQQYSEATTIMPTQDGNARLYVAQDEASSILTVAAIVNDDVVATLDLTVYQDNNDEENDDTGDNDDVGYVGYDDVGGDYGYDVGGDYGHAHKYGKWTTDLAATALKRGIKSRICKICGEEEFEPIKKLKPKMTLPMMPNNKLVMKAGQSTTGLKVTGLAKADSVKSINSNRTSIITVSKVKNNSCTLKAKKKGTATITITLKSGLKKRFTISVQTNMVKTTKITGLKSSVSLKKGKSITLKPVKVPFTSQEKITYRSSNTKIATVTSTGKIVGKKKGSTTITVKSGSKLYKVKVTVK